MEKVYTASELIEMFDVVIEDRLDGIFAECVDERYANKSPEYRLLVKDLGHSVFVDVFMEQSKDSGPYHDAKKAIMRVCSGMVLTQGIVLDLLISMDVMLTENFRQAGLKDAAMDILVEMEG